jgi:hypothetical protein
MSGMSDEEIDQTPQLGHLPEEAGIFVNYRFTTRDLTETEDFRLLRAVIARIEELNEDQTTSFLFLLAGKVVIFFYEGKTLDVSATADYGVGVVELWTSVRGNDWYVKKTYKGDPDDLLEYLKKGFVGTPTVEEGKVSEEPKTSLGKKLECRGKALFRLTTNKETL